MNLNRPSVFYSNNQFLTVLVRALTSRDYLMKSLHNSKSKGKRE